MLKTNYKDEVLPLGERYRKYNIVGEDGRTIQSNVHLEKAYVPKQKGDSYGAGDINVTNETINGLTPSNLLVNGDFQVWQRGDRLELSPNQYGCDMWKVSTNCTIEKVPNGLRVVSGTNVTLTQTVEGNFDTKIMTQCYSINGIKKLDKSPYSGGKIVVQITGLNTGDVVNYCDLFIGNNGYQHAKEDYALAIQRCYRYLYVIPLGNVGDGFVYYTSDGDVVANGSLNVFVPAEMKNKPTLIATNVQAFVSRDIQYKKTDLTVQALNGNVIELAFSVNVGKNTDGQGIQFTTYAPFILTCEPL